MSLRCLIVSSICIKNEDRTLEFGFTLAFRNFSLSLSDFEGSVDCDFIRLLSVVLERS